MGIPDADEVVVVNDPGDSKFVALYRAGDRCVGALTVSFPAQTMKYRKLIAGHGSWQEALELARSLA